MGIIDEGHKMGKKKNKDVEKLRKDREHHMNHLRIVKEVITKKRCR